ncbi:LytR/AlgR family response regulator transcription factor [Hyphomonas sp.]|jgi:two-component system LytT family response regulator|uniref:LytR/AlgR family response regulator transcription factor n=1 Tax=Hyphomonas sp. TaxID=87 RepID=UPI0039E62D7D
MKIRAVISDDEGLSIDLLQILLSEMQSFLGQIEVVKTCTSGAETLRAVEALSPDLLFLDISMPAGDGILVADTLRRSGRSLPQIIFTTAHAEYAAKAFDLEAADYLLKPIQADRLQRAIERAIASRNALVDQSLSKIIPVPVLGGIEMIDATRIEWVEASGDYVHLHIGNRNFMVRKTLTNFGSDVYPILLQTHRSYLVNPSFVTRVMPKAKGEALLLMTSGMEVPVSRTHRDVLRGIVS